MAHAQPTALQPIASLDVPRYIGTWYEIAKYPNSFQKKCVRNTRASVRHRAMWPLPMVGEASARISTLIAVLRRP